MHQTQRKDWHRMMKWLLVALMLYAAAFFMTRQDHFAPAQTVLWKLGHVTLGGYAGYWLDRAAFRDRICWDTPPLIMIRRAIIMAAAMYTLGTGL